MAHALPPVGHAAREMFAVEDLVAVAMGEQPVLAGIGQARAAARKFFAGADPAARRVVYFVVRCDDSLELISFGRRLGHKVEWKFGPCGRGVKLA